MTTQTLTGAPTLPRVNLLPPEIAEARRAKRVKAGLGSAVAIALLAVGGLYQSARGGVSSASDELASAQQENASLQHQLTDYQNVTAMKERVAAAQANLRLAMGPQVLWSHYLSDLSLILPGNVWLTKIQVKLTGPAEPGVSLSPIVSVLP